MSKSTIGEQQWAEMTVAQKVEAVRSGYATLRQLSGGLLDGPGELRIVCQDFLAQTDSSFATLPAESTAPNSYAERALTAEPPPLDLLEEPRPATTASKQKSGLPENFVPRVQRQGRSILLEDNIYRLPNGQEFIPQLPRGPVSNLRHLYSLVTLEQYSNCKTGSVYVRTDGRIFDYGADHADQRRDSFDTGFTIYDLARTGKYAPKRKG